MVIWPQPTAQRYVWSTMGTLNLMVLENSMFRLDFLMKSNSDFTKYLHPIIVSSNTMRFRVNTGDHMCFCSCGKGILNLKHTSGGQSIVIWPQPMAQRYMWSPMWALNPIVLEDSMPRLDLLMKSNLVSTKYLDPIMMSSNTRVNLGDYMCFCSCG